MAEQTPLVGIVMGSASDWEPVMRFAHDMLEEFGVWHESRVMSAHRTPEDVAQWAAGAEARGMEAVIAGAGGAAHLAGVVAAHTAIPVIGVPIPSALNGLDSLLSTAQMPAGVPVATMAIGKPGAINAALLAISILSNSRPALREKLHQYRKQRAEQVRSAKLE